MKIKLTFLSVVFSLSSAMATISGTNTWIGATSGGSWKTASNWKSVKSDGTVNADASTTFNSDFHYVYDFSSLKDGATVSNDCTAEIRIAGMTFAADQGTITLARGTKDFYFSPAVTISMGTGTTVNYELKHTYKWNDNGAKLTFTGGGIFVFNVTDLGLAGSAELILSGATTLRFAKTPADYSYGYYLTALKFLDSASTVDLQADDIRFKSIESAKGITPVINLNGHSMGVVFASGASLDTFSFDGYFNGPGNVYLQGGNAIRFTNAQALRNDATLQVKTVQVTDTTVSSSTTLRMDDNGRFTVGGDATVARLAGDGTMGKVEIADGKTLTVGADGTTGSDTYSARLIGNGRLVKDGADYTLTLLGEDALAGGTQVKAGTLALKGLERDPVPDGLVAHWTFDDPDNLGHDDSGHGVFLKGVNVSASDGVFGGAVHLTKGTGSNGGYLIMTNTLGEAGLPIGADAISFAYWMKVSEWPASSGDIQVSIYGTWTSGGRMYLMRGYPSGDLSFSSADAICNLSATGVIKTGSWLHIVGTYDGNHNRVLYVNGVQNRLGTDATGTTMNIASNDTFTIGHKETRSFAGDVDDYRIYNRALSADEVKLLYDAGTGGYAFPESVDPVSALPKPVAQYTFNDASNLGADTSGNGYNLTAEGTVAAVSSRLGAYGGCAKLSGSSYLKASAVPEKVPTNGSFSVSVRVQPGCVNSQSFVFWGADSTTAGSFFRAGANNNSLLEQVGSFSVNSDLIVSDFFTSYAGYSDTTGSEETWLHMVYTCDLETKTLRAYRDGHLVKSLSFTTTFKATRDCFYLGYWPCGKNVKAICHLDDVRIFDCALSNDQVRTLTRSLATGSVSPVVAANAPVEVKSGATLATTGLGNAVPQLSGAGTLSVGAFGSLTLSDAANFTGAVTGKGTLYLRGAMGGSTANFAGAVALAEDYQFVTDNTSKNLPAVAFDGTVKLPTAASIKFDAMIATMSVKRFVLAEAKAFTGATSFANWTSADPAQYTVTYAIETASGKKQLVATVKYHRGVVLILK